VKNTDAAKEKGYEVGKKVSGINDILLLDTQGVLHAIAITIPNVTDRVGANAILKQNKRNPSRVKMLL
jgi:hypothetical protein